MGKGMGMVSVRARNAVPVVRPQRLRRVQKWVKTQKETDAPRPGYPCYGDFLYLNVGGWCGG